MLIERYKAFFGYVVWVVISFYHLLDLHLGDPGYTRHRVRRTFLGQVASTEGGSKQTVFV